VDELVSALSLMSTSSVYYHFIDARRRTTSGSDDFSAWLSDTGSRSTALIEVLAGVDPYFVTLADLRSQLISVCTDWAQRGVFS
jgi:hypothetical protein